MKASRQIGNGSITPLSGLCALSASNTGDVMRRHHVVQAFAVIGHEGIPVDQAPQPVRKMRSATPVITIPP